MRTPARRLGWARCNARNADRLRRRVLRRAWSRLSDGQSRPRAPRSASATSKIWRRPCSLSRQRSRSVGTIGVVPRPLAHARARAATKIPPL